MAIVVALKKMTERAGIKTVLMKSWTMYIAMN